MNNKRKMKKKKVKKKKRKCVMCPLPFYSFSNVWHKPFTALLPASYTRTRLQGPEWSCNVSKDKLILLFWET
jgi:hypothetical protein